MAGLSAVLLKDLKLELRSGQSTIALVGLSLLILVVLVFALGNGNVRGPEGAAGALWVALVFAGTVGATKALVAEGENGCLRGLVLSPVDRSTLFAAKMAAAAIFMAVAEVAAVALMVLFFNLQFDERLARIVPSLALGIIGFAALATLLAAVSGRTRAADLLMPILAVPMFVPALIAGVKASAGALAGRPLSALHAWLGILVAFDVIFVVSGYLLFEQVARED